MMFDSVSVFNFSGIYDEESFYQDDKGSSFYDADGRMHGYKAPDFKVYDLKDMSGTNCMCDDEAVGRIRRLLSDEKVIAGEIHFIDSGNYHYMSALLTELVKEPFELVVLDHHPDMQAPMFGDILSCGGWILKVLKENQFVRGVHVIGADKGLISQLDPEDVGKVHFYPEFADVNVSDESGHDRDTEVISVREFVRERLSGRYPVYLSIDKDVLSRDELITNWDQGQMAAEQLFLLVKELAGKDSIPGENESVPGGKLRLLGVDVCGECAPDQEDCDVAKAIAGNNEFNRKLLELLLNKCDH